jgi:hypothetical protein
MKYLCLVYFEGSALTALSPADKAQLDRDSIAYDGELERSGNYITSHALRSVDDAATVRVRSGKMSVTDGPFAETKEQLGGFILIDARDMNEALRLAAGIPLAKLGSIEVRPTMEIEEYA